MFRVLRTPRGGEECDTGHEEHERSGCQADSEAASSDLTTADGLRRGFGVAQAVAASIAWGTTRSMPRRRLAAQPVRASLTWARTWRARPATPFIPPRRRGTMGFAANGTTDGPGGSHHLQSQASRASGAGCVDVLREDRCLPHCGDSWRRHAACDRAPAALGAGHGRGMGPWEVFDPEGRLLASLPVREWKARSVPAFGPDHMVTIRQDSLEIDYVDVWRIDTGGAIN